MKKYLTRIILIVAFMGLALYELWPTWMDTTYESALAELTGADSTAYFDEHEEGIRDARARRLKLGLDLQGGMYVTLEVNTVELLDKLAKNQDETLREILKETKAEADETDEPVLEIFNRKFSDRGMRLSRYYGDIRDSNADVVDKLSNETGMAVERALEIIRNRIDQYGVSEVAITRSGSRRIMLELPGVSDEREVRKLIQETAQLEFKLMADPNLSLKAIDNLNKVLLGKDIEEELGEDDADSDTTAVDPSEPAAEGDDIAGTRPEDSQAESAAADDEVTGDGADITDARSTADSISEANMTPEEQLAKFNEENPFTALFQWGQGGRLFADDHQKERINNILHREDVLAVIPSGISFAWSAKGRLGKNDEGKDIYEFYILKEKAELTGEVVTDARAQVDQQGFGGAVVTMQMDSEGSREWARITGANVEKQIAIVLDNVVFSAPSVRQKIIGGNSQIEGMANMEEARLLEIVLKAGALPAPVDIIQERTVGPSLGEDSISSGMNSFFMGLVLVLLFMVVYYQYAGFSADLAVLFNVIFILGILAGFHATLTLPGIAGILLTIGMAVDANVLINERIREEFDAGKTLRAAVDAGYSRAFPAIIDSNLTTLIVCIILYQFGSGPIQGFALTLMIGIISSLFTAIVLTRVIIESTLDSRPNLVKFG